MEQKALLQQLVLGAVVQLAAARRRARNIVMYVDAQELASISPCVPNSNAPDRVARHSAASVDPRLNLIHSLTPTNIARIVRSGALQRLGATHTRSSTKNDIGKAL
mmetsp:Transcript_1533/g.3233  ORF Transcript_1533/g.3233 Transcript_1533/m.3233 type:complete len:106 (-) Transcript_1533:109-426(-)